jgi:hypothetical protein
VLCTCLRAELSRTLGRALAEVDSTELVEVSSIITLGFFSWRRQELSAFASAPTGIASIVPGQRLVVFSGYELRALPKTLEHRTSSSAQGYGGQAWAAPSFVE